MRPSGGWWWCTGVGGGVVGGPLKAREYVLHGFLVKYVDEKKRDTFGPINRPTDGRTDGQTHPPIEMRGPI